jgi:predicted ATP-grasp superfamily ATP-dependent carboligase
MRKDVPVLVIYRGGNGALGVARTLGRLRIPVYLVTKKGDSLVEHSRYWTKRFWWDFSAPPEESRRFLLDVADLIGTRTILLTLSDWAAIFIEDNAQLFRERFIVPQPPQPVIRKLANKWGMFTLAKTYGIPTPETAHPSSRDEVLKFLETARFPIVTKAADPTASHVPGKRIVHDARELLEKYDREAALGPPNLVFQEYIPGDAGSVWMCNAYFGKGSKCLAVFTGKKLRQVDETGIASLAVCLPNETVAEQTQRLMQAVGYEGAVGIGYRFDARDGLYKLLDVNARLSGIFRLFRATNGMDIVRICYLDLTGQPVPSSALETGRKWMLEDDILAARACARQGSLTFKQWLTSIRGVKETQWFAFDDPLPGLIWFWKWLWSVVVSKVSSNRTGRAVPVSRSGDALAS